MDGLPLSILAAVAGLLSGGLGVIGGGTGLLPTALIAAATGDIVLAVGVSKVTVYLAAILPTAVMTSGRAKPQIHREHAAHLLVIVLTSLGAAMLLTRLPTTVANLAGGALLLVASASLGLTGSARLPGRDGPDGSLRLITSALLGLHAALLPGTGSMVLVALQKVFGMKPDDAVWVKPIAQAVIMAPAVAIYSARFQKDLLPLFLPLMGGLALGAYLGVRAAERTPSARLRRWMQWTIGATAVVMFLVALGRGFSEGAQAIAP